MTSKPSPAAPTLAVLGLFGSPNLGNEATLAAFVEAIEARLPGVRWRAIVARQSTLGARSGWEVLALDPMPLTGWFWRVRPEALREAFQTAAQWLSEPWRQRHATRALAGADALIVPGTGVVDDFGQGSSDMPAHLHRWVKAACAHGIPVCFVSIGASRVQSRFSRALFRRALRGAAYCSVRDQASLANLRDIGHAGEVVVAPDLAFGLEGRVDRRQAATRRVIGVGVMGYYGWNRHGADAEAIHRDYLERIVAVVRALLARGHVVRLLLGDHRADTATLDEVLNACPGAQRADTPTFRELRDEIASLDALVATRFHNVLFALHLQRPVISLGYSDKNDALMTTFGLQRCMHGVESFDPALVVAQVEDLLAAAPGSWGDRLQAHRNDLAAQYRRLTHIVETPA